MRNTFMMQELMRTCFDQYTENPEDEHTAEELVVFAYEKVKRMLRYSAKWNKLSNRSVHTKLTGSFTRALVSIFFTTLATYSIERYVARMSPRKDLNYLLYSAIHLRTATLSAID